MTELHDKYMTATQAAEALNKTVSWIGRICRQGGFPGAEKMGISNWLIPREAVLNYKPNKRGVKPGAQSKKAKLAAELAAFLAEAKEVV